MTTMRARNRSFKIVATLGMVLLMAFISACDLLATEGARDAIANGREIREFEAKNLRPLEDEMNDLWVNEIQPRETKLEDLRRESERIREEVISPLWASQNDMWAAGGEASEAQLVFDARYREIELLERALQVEQRELDTRWQDVWNGDSFVDPDHQALEDLRYEKQRELDRIYRFGYRPIDDIWDQINELNSAQGSSNTDSQIQVEKINVELRRLWDLISVMQDGNSDEANRLNDRAFAAQDELNQLYNHGWDPINDIYSEIERLENDRSSSSVDANSIAAQISELEGVKTSYITNRDAEIAAWTAQLENLDTAGSDVVVTDNSARIAELVQIIGDLEAEAAVLPDVKHAEIDELNDDINSKQIASEEEIDEVTNDFLALSASLLADAAAIDDQIAEIAPDSDGAAEQIVNLQAQKAGLIAQEEAEEQALHETVAEIVAHRDADVTERQAKIDEIQALLDDGLTDEIDAQIAAHNAELESLQNDDGNDGNDGNNSETTADIQANIDASHAYWGDLISEITTRIVILDNELRVGSVDDTTDDRIQNLKLQAADLEEALNSKIAQLEALVNELFRQANNTDFGSSGAMEEIQAQIDALNARLEEIWQGESAAGLEVMLKVQELEKQARILEEENEQITRQLEEELWEMDEKLSLFYRDQETVRKALQVELEAISANIQLRKQDLEEQRWAIDEEQRTVFSAIELAQKEATEQIRLIEEEEFGAIRTQVKAIEEELRTFRNEQWELESAIRDAQAMVEQKQRELEDKVFEALESAAGTVDQAGDTVLTATEESIPEFFEGDATPTSSSN